GPVEELPLDLILAEYEARRQRGDVPPWEEFLRRFPRHAGTAARTVTLPSALVATGPSGGAPAPPAVRPDRPLGSLPERFGRYRIERKLGKGGMGSVYLAHDTQLDRPVALKVPNFAGDEPEVLARFYREARAAALLRHPNLCPVYDVGEIDGVH